jgi:Na+/H+-dicarboxylate symporter
MKKSNKLTVYILIAMVAGAALGYYIHENGEQSTIDTFSKNIKLLTTIFLRLIQMIIAPLVFTTLVVGIAKLGDLKTVGRVGGKALLWFITASLVSLLIGLILVNIFKPGEGIALSNADISGAKDLMGKTQSFSIVGFIEHVFPKSMFEALANNEILQIVVFSIFFGVAAAAMGEKANGLIKAFDTAAHIILINYSDMFSKSENFKKAGMSIRCIENN